MTLMRRPIVAQLLAFLVSCGSSETSPAPGADGGSAAADASDAAAVFDSSDSDAASELPPLGGSRPLPLFRAPEGWDGTTPLPLVLVLHGYGAGGLVQTVYFRLESLVEQKKFLLAAPDGTVDDKGKRFWNAMDSCCDFAGAGVDDVKYLTDLVEEIAARYAVDRKRVYLVGHSNGGAMSFDAYAAPPRLTQTRFPSNTTP
jgi:polyhydroxybutyrate depolymerase